MFSAIKQHATGSYHGKIEHGMLIIKIKEQNYFTELIPKINRKDGSIHANLANDMTDSDLVKITVHNRNNDK